MADYNGSGQLHLGENRVRVAYLIRVTGDDTNRRAGGTIVGLSGEHLNSFLSLGSTILETEEHGDLEVLPAGGDHNASRDRVSITVNTPFPSEPTTLHGIPDRL